MAIQANITRRVALLGAVVSSVALAVPAFAFAKRDEQAERDALLLRFLNESDDRVLAQYHATHMAGAVQRLKGGRWRLTYDDAGDFLLLVHDKGQSPGLMVENFGWTIGRRLGI